MNDQTILELASPNDVPEYVRIRGLTRENAITLNRLTELGITADAWADEIRSKVLLGYVARSGGRIVGYCFGNTRSGEIVVLALLPCAEGNGVGRDLLELVVKALAQMGHGRLYLGCSADPRVRSYGFYRHLGWNSTGRQDTYGDEELELLLP